MIPFSTLSPLIRAFFALWALLLCLAAIGGGLFALLKKRFLFSALALLLFCPVFFSWQVLFDLSLFYMEKTAGVSSVVQTLCALPWIAWLSVFLVFSASAALILGYAILYSKNHITPGSIKSYLDGIPCGVCCYRENGRVLFSNVCMNELSVSITDEPLLNGNQFFDTVRNEILPVEDKRWRFSHRELFFGGERMHELIASDVTTEYAKTQALEKDKAELSRLNQKLREYTLGIDETVRRQEILQAKANIHDEMNKLMLSTVAAEKEDVDALDKIFSLWEQNALLLCKQAEETSNANAVYRLEELAEALKIRLTWEEDLSDSLREKQRDLFFFAAQEAIANAAKHAQAKELKISFLSTEDGLCCRFTNDGIAPRGEIPFCGGLANLARLAEEQDAVVSTNVEKGAFTLSVRFPVQKQPIG